MFDGFYAGKRVLVTGHSGFKGGWLSLWLKKLGAHVTGLGLAAPTDPNLHEVIAPNAFDAEIECDIRDKGALFSAIRDAQPEVIFHLAAQAIVRRSYVEPLETFETNTLGTAYVLEAIRASGQPCTLLVVTSDKCYENREWDFAYRENDAMGGHDVYSMSKGAAELVVQAWRWSFFASGEQVRVATARAGNVIGGGDYAADRIVPDCVRSLRAGQPITVRNPGAIRPWQHVLESVSGYLCLAARLATAGDSSALASGFNFGPGQTSQRPVRDLVETVLKIWPGSWHQPDGGKQVHEAGKLSLSIEKAVSLLQWLPVWDFDQAVRETITWYHRRHVLNDTGMLGFSLAQIETYASTAVARGLTWTCETA